jgi:hypothetical protein
MKANIIGFGPDWQRQRSSRWIPTKTCPFHHCILIPKKKENGEYEPGLWCPKCGFLEMDVGLVVK